VIIVVVENSGGVAEHIHTFDLGGSRKVRVEIVDWDNIEAGDNPPFGRPRITARDLSSSIPPDAADDWRTYKKEVWRQVLESREPDATA